MIALTAAGMLVLLAGAATIGALVLNQGSGSVASNLVTTASQTPTPSTPAATSRPTASPAAKPAAPAPTKRPAVAPARKLTATLGGQYCPVAYLNQNACWHGTLVNTGPRIGKLALIFVIGGGYTNWFATHSSPALSGFYTTPGCVLDISHGRMLCGAVPTGGHQQGRHLPVRGEVRGHLGRDHRLCESKPRRNASGRLVDRGDHLGIEQKKAGRHRDRR